MPKELNKIEPVLLKTLCRYKQSRCGKGDYIDIEQIKNIYAMSYSYPDGEGDFSVYFETLEDAITYALNVAHYWTHIYEKTTSGWVDLQQE